MPSLSPSTKLQTLWIAIPSMIVWLAVSVVGRQQDITYLHRYLPTSDPTLDSAQTVGYRTCANCHKSEFGVWQKTWHHTSFRTLHRSPEAMQIAGRLGLNSVKYSQRCVRCHYTETEFSDQVNVDAAVSCESCHGAGKNWYSTHFPVDTVGQAESLFQKDQRVSRNIQNGMRNRHNTYTMARICMRCHNVSDEELVNVGGHSMGNLDFEMVAWSQGMMRHRFVSGRGNSNKPNSLERLSVMFVSGMIADLEFSLRATANATKKNKFGIQAANRSLQAANRLAKIQESVQLPIIESILTEYQAIRLRSNNAKELLRAAEAIQELGVRFAAETNGSQLEKIRDLVPNEANWIWE